MVQAFGWSPAAAGEVVAGGPTATTGDSTTAGENELASEAILAMKMRKRKEQRTTMQSLPS